MAGDRYGSFDELRRAEREGVDFRIRVIRREASVAIIGPHGGWIEPGTSEIAEAIADDDYSLYCFEGLQDRPHEELHITSAKFDEPTCVGLVAACDQVVAVHGRAGRQHQSVEVGGLDANLRDEICRSVQDAGFSAEVVTSGGLAALSPANICNRGARRAGVQLEITRGLRDTLLAQPQRLANFARAVRRAIHAWAQRAGRGEVQPVLRDFCDADAAAVRQLALAGFEEFRDAYSDWPAMSASISQMPALAKAGELIVAELDGKLVGAVTYVAPSRPKADFFDATWPIIRMLVVDPAARGKGVGRALMAESCCRAKRDGAHVLALHTSPIMTAALAMYRAIGFRFQRNAPEIYGVPSAVYLMQLAR